MGQQDIAFPWPESIGCHVRQGAAYPVVKILDLFIRETAPHHGRLDKWQHINIHAAVSIPKFHRLHMAVIHRSHVHPSANHQLPAKSQALRAVVIPADYKHRHAAISQAGEE